MSATRNIDSINNKQGEFQPSRPRDEPQTTHGHKPGVKASPADFAPEFHAKTVPPGTAPADRTFQPNPTGETPNTQPVDPNGIGADSRDVHKGLGHPGSGQTSSEIRHEGASHRTRQSAGLEGVGASGGAVSGETRPSQRALDKEEGAAAGTRSTKGAVGAEEMTPNSA
ncbi:hypothetical protein FQN54_005178 [Arachnomyces sp. PD_36]|nr:hypothetical protein FQN54_005178 [Arachnomyces sp. PD_36]